MNEKNQEKFRNWMEREWPYMKWTAIITTGLFFGTGLVLETAQNTNYKKEQSKENYLQVQDSIMRYVDMNNDGKITADEKLEFQNTFYLKTGVSLPEKGNPMYRNLEKLPTDSATKILQQYMPQLK